MLSFDFVLFAFAFPSSPNNTEGQQQTQQNIPTVEVTAEDNAVEENETEGGFVGLTI